MYRTIAAAVALLGVTLAAPAIAGQSVEEVQGRVSRAGLSLSDSSDLAELKERVARVAKKICTAGVSDRLHSGPDIKACRASVIGSGKLQIAKLAGGHSAD